MKLAKIYFVIFFLFFCFDAYSETGTSVQSWDKLQAVEATPFASKKNYDFRCMPILGSMDEAKLEMNKKNTLFRNACDLYQGWIDLFRRSNCKDPAKEVPLNFSCDTAIASACQEINSLETEAWRWMDRGFQGCVPEFWEAGCQKLNSASSQCRAVHCPDSCQTQFDCSLESFLIVLRTNNYQDKSACIREVEKRRVR